MQSGLTSTATDHRDHWTRWRSPQHPELLVHPWTGKTLQPLLAEMKPFTQQVSWQRCTFTCIPLQYTNRQSSLTCAHHDLFQVDGNLYKVENKTHCSTFIKVFELNQNIWKFDSREGRLPPQKKKKKKKKKKILTQFFLGKNDKNLRLKKKCALLKIGCQACKYIYQDI